MEPMPSLEVVLNQLRARGVTLPPGTCRVDAFGDSAALSENLLGLIRAGGKRGGASLLWSYEFDKEAIAASGDIAIILDYENVPALITRITRVEVVPFEAVTAEFAASEGEGDLSLAWWREAHWRFFSRECLRIGREPANDMMVVCSNFEVLQDLAAPVTGGG